MKRLFAILILPALIFSLCACTGGAYAETTPESSAPATTKPTVPETTAPEIILPETTAAPTEPAARIQIGCYTLSGISSNGQHAGEDMVASLGSYLQILEDHTGVWFISGTKADILWDDTTLTAPGAQLEYWFEGDTLAFSTGTTIFHYSYAGEDIPEEYVIHKAFGTYFAGSVGYPDGSILSFETLDPANGYLTLNEDGTGYLCYDGKEGSITWDDSLIYLNGTVFKYIYYTEQFNADGRPSILVGFPDSSTTVMFHLAAE